MDTNLRNREMKLLENIFFGVANDEQHGISLRGSESGLDHAELITSGRETQWKFRIYCEEIFLKNKPRGVLKRKEGG